MKDKIIPVIGIVFLVVFYLTGNHTLAIVFGLTIIISYAGMSLLEHVGSKNAPKTSAKDEDSNE